MANKQAKFDLSGILDQIAEPLTPSEKWDLEAGLTSLINNTIGKLEESRKRQYSLNEVRTKKVPYLNLLVKDIELSLLSASQDANEGEKQVDAFKFYFEDFVGYRSVTDTGWNLYLSLEDIERDEVIEKAYDKIKSEYGNKIDAELFSKLVPIVKDTIEKIGQSERRDYLDAMGLSGN